MQSCENKPTSDSPVPNLASIIPRECIPSVGGRAYVSGNGGAQSPLAGYSGSLTLRAVCSTPTSRQPSSRCRRSHPGTSAGGSSSIGTHSSLETLVPVNSGFVGWMGPFKGNLYLFLHLPSVSRIRTGPQHRVQNEGRRGGGG